MDKETEAIIVASRRRAFLQQHGTCEKHKGYYQTGCSRCRNQLDKQLNSERSEDT